MESIRPLCFRLVLILLIFFLFPIFSGSLQHWQEESSSWIRSQLFHLYSSSSSSDADTLIHRYILYIRFYIKYMIGLSLLSMSEPTESSSVNKRKAKPPPDEEDSVLSGKAPSLPHFFFSHSWKWTNTMDLKSVYQSSYLIVPCSLMIVWPENL